MSLPFDATLKNLVQDYQDKILDQHVTPGTVEDYTEWVHLVAAMLRGGFTQEEAGKIAVLVEH